MSASTQKPTEELLQREAAISVSAVKMAPETDPAPPLLHSGEWADPVPIPGKVNTAGAEDSPFILPDGNTLYFFFTPDLTVPAEKQLVDRASGIYAARLQDGAWGEVQRVLLQSPGKAALDGCPFVQTDEMWFCSAREGFEGINWFIARSVDGAWKGWQPAADQFGPGYEVGELHITADGSEMYYHSARPGGKGQLDIWVTKRSGGKWQEPLNVSAVNSPEAEGWPFLSQDGEELWFTRYYLGAPAVFRSVRVGEDWSAPELIVSQFAGEPTLDGQGNLYFVHHFMRDGQMIEADLYVAYRK